MIVEMSVVICVMLRAGIRVPYHVLDWRLCLPKLRTLLVVGIPSGVQVVAEVLAWSLFGAWVIGVFGTTAMSANNYMMRYMILGFMPCFGISTAVTALVGRYIGMGRPDLAERRAHLGFLVAAVYMVACGAFFYIARRPLIGLFTDDPEIIRQGAVLLTFAAGYVVFDAMYIVYNSALRGAGDTFVPAVATGLLCWSIMLGGGFWVAHFFPGLGAAGPWIAGMVYGISLGLFVFFRFRRGGWKLIHLDDPANAATLNGPRTDMAAVEQLATGN
jgi:MATE family multidrug resistance protein